jgi:hypothetical protein
MNSSDIESRLMILERRVNRYRLSSVVLGLALVGLAGIAATAPTGVSPEVRTHRLAIVDDKGRETAHITSAPHGGLLTLVHTNGMPAIRMGAGELGGKLTVFDAKGEPNVQASAEVAGGELLLQDKKGAKNLMKATK